METLRPLKILLLFSFLSTASWWMLPVESFAVTARPCSRPKDKVESVGQHKVTMIKTTTTTGTMVTTRGSLLFMTEKEEEDAKKKNVNKGLVEILLDFFGANQSLLLYILFVIIFNIFYSDASENVVTVLLVGIAIQVIEVLSRTTKSELGEKISSVKASLVKMSAETTAETNERIGAVETTLVKATAETNERIGAVEATLVKATAEIKFLISGLGNKIDSRITETNHGMDMHKKDVNNSLKMLKKDVKNGVEMLKKDVNHGVEMLKKDVDNNLTLFKRELRGKIGEKEDEKHKATQNQSVDQKIESVRKDVNETKTYRESSKKQGE